MLTSKALLLGTTIFAVFSFYALFHSLYQFQLKFDDTSNINFLSQDNPTWFQRKAKVVFVIVDGLRFDYLLNYKNIEHDTTLDGNKFHKFNQAYFDNPDKFVIFKAFADLPTMTVLRVPCMMTGNVPRLGSVLTAFGALPATEDSIPRQLYLHQKKSYFAGDPILPQYFPKYLTSDFTIGAFNVRDRFVDDPSHSFMNEKLKKNDFDFLGGHFLEVDHAGHHSGLATKLMKKSIASLDKYLLEIINNIDDDTMLLFAGDHGMTKVGSHGGGSHQETNTAIVAYYKKGFMKNKYKNRHLKKVMRSINETQGQVNQIDIVPTLSMLMGLPTPFSNMGQILNDLYPVGDYLPSSQQNCHDSAFIMQMLQDNHLNTLQIWNYFKRYHDEQDLFNQQEYLPVAELYQEVDAAYKAADEMIKEHRQCEQSFHKIALDAIQKSQQLANQIHDLVSHKPPHDLIIFWQAFILLVLVSISYILQVQYLHKTKDYEYINFTWTSLENWNGKAIAKRVSPLAIILTLIWVYALTNSYPLMRPITSTVLALGLWILGSSIISFFFKPQEQLSPATTLEDEEQRAFSFSIKSFVLFQNPLVFACAAGIVSCLFYLTHIAGLRKSIIPALPSEIPYICVILLAFRISGRYLKLSPYIIGAAVFVCVGINIFHLSRLWSQRNNIILGLVMIADWLWGEAQFTNKKLKAGKIWSYQYIAGFIVLVFYHHILRPSSDLVQIYLPRVIWAIAIGSILTSFVLKMPRKVIKRNMQINLVIFLTLMQVHKKLIYFGVALSIMRIATFIFKRTSFKNYLYPLILGLLSYIGLYAIGFDDLKLPRRFGPAFVGLHDFHLSSCLLLFSSAILSTIILGMLFMSFYSQDLELQEVELGIQKEETSVKVVALKGHSNIIRKRNLIMYCFFYNLLMIGAAINPVIMKRPKAIFGAMERFLVDGAFYLFTVNVLCFIS